VGVVRIPVFLCSLFTVHVLLLFHNIICARSGSTTWCNLPVHDIMQNFRRWVTNSHTAAVGVGYYSCSFVPPCPCSCSWFGWQELIEHHHKCGTVILLLFTSIQSFHVEIYRNKKSVTNSHRAVAAGAVVFPVHVPVVVAVSYYCLVDRNRRSKHDVPGVVPPQVSVI
jgi:hypothetical protein